MKKDLPIKYVSPEVSVDSCFWQQTVLAASISVQGIGINDAEEIEWNVF
ncbi:MAG: hypothetical protein K6E37_09020 [Bacteroidales bacterium]|nr:hypothetical protein [Bacteroidales bacterium]